MASFLEQLDMTKLPQHIAIIMDGNGRWANEKGQERIHGHAQGVESVRAITQAVAKLKIPYLTLYSFSTENWSRPQEEVMHLMNLLAESLEKEFETLNQNNIRLHTIGDLKKLPLQTQQKIEQVITQTKNNTHLNLVMALNYSSRSEIHDAVQRIAQDVEDKKMTSTISQKQFESYLATAGMPEPELLIRTGGEQRISNFLLYQVAYTELYFTETYWPDFREDNLYAALLDFQKRERRFGKTSQQIQDNQ